MKIREKIEEMMTAATFAESNEHDVARQIMGVRRRRRKRERLRTRKKLQRQRRERPRMYLRRPQ